MPATPPASSAVQRNVQPVRLTEESLTTLWPFKAKAAIFDFDGTIAHSLDIWKTVDDIFFARRGLTYAPDYAHQLSILGFEDGARYTIEMYGLNDTPEQICAEWNQLGRELYQTKVNLRPYAEAYVTALADMKIPIGLATTNRPYVLEAVAPRINLDALFPVRVYGQDVAHKTKQDPDIYLECARRLNVSPHECAVFEDIPTGIQTARRAGMTTVAVLTNPIHQDEEAVTQMADYIIEDWQIFKRLL